MQGFQILAVFCVLVSLGAAENRKISLPKPQKNNICLNKDDGALLPVAGSCSKFVICMNGTSIEKTCGEYHFNAKILACDLPALSGCNKLESSPIQTTSKPVSEKEIVVPSATRSPCFAVANGVSLPVPGNQRQYYYCLNNKAFVKDCGNMYFDVKYSACSVNPSSFDSSNTFATTKVPLSQDNTESNVCLGKRNGVSLPVAGNSRLYNFCMNNKAFLKDCGSKMIFDPKYSACSLAAIESEEESDTHPDYEIEQTKEFKQMASKICKNQNFGARLSVPGYCSLYVFCTINTGFIKTCGWREFNSKTASCDLPQNVQCEAKKQQAADKLPEIQTTSKPSISSDLADRICLNKNDGAFVAAPELCSDFFFCLKNKGYRKSCGLGRHFNPKSQICVDAKHSKCVDTIKKTERAIIPRADASCVNKENGTLMSSMNSCEKFIICDNGVAREMDCPSRLHFNPQENICDWPTNVNCSI